MLQAEICKMTSQVPSALVFRQQPRAGGHVSQESQRHSTSHAAPSPEPGEPPQVHASNAQDASAIATEYKLEVQICKAYIDKARLDSPEKEGLEASESPEVE